MPALKRATFGIRRELYENKLGKKRINLATGTELLPQQLNINARTCYTQAVECGIRLPHLNQMTHPTRIECDQIKYLFTPHIAGAAAQRMRQLATTASG